jgi:glycosyltransferase involved in cell wall biosynthesis
MSRVLLVGKGAPDRGGIPSFLEDLRAGPVAEDHQVTFLNVAHEAVPEGGRLSLANVRRTLRDAQAVWKASADHDVVHISSALAPTVTVLRAGLLASAGRLRGAAVIVHAHGGNIETWLTGRLARAVMRTAMRPAHTVVAVWHAGRTALADTLGEDRVQLVRNGVDVDRFRPADRSAHGHESPPRVLYVGLLTPRKGVLDLLAASQLLRERGLDHELCLLGGTPDEGPEAAQPVLEAARGHAELLGTRPPAEVPEVYAAADVFCLPSWWEAMPLSVLEAMAAGLPVVATDVGEVAEVVENGVTGFVVPVRHPEQLAGALADLLEDEALRRKMGSAGRDRAVTFFSSRSTGRTLSALFTRAAERAG